MLMLTLCFLLSSDGAQGPQGARGRNGIDGARGATGASGQRGAVGAKGAKGDPGDAGPVGAMGPMGPQGIAGGQGAPGLNSADTLKVWISSPRTLTPYQSCRDVCSARGTETGVLTACFSAKHDGVYAPCTASSLFFITNAQCACLAVDG